VLSDRLVEGLQRIAGVRVYGITDPEQFDHRIATVSFTLDGVPPATLAAQLGEQNIFVWDGDFYALEVVQQLGLAPNGLLRIGAAHYNTTQEIDRVLEAVDAVARRRR